MLKTFSIVFIIFTTFLAQAILAENDFLLDQAPLLLAKKKVKTLRKNQIKKKPNSLKRSQLKNKKLKSKRKKNYVTAKVLFNQAPLLNSNTEGSKIILTLKEGEILRIKQVIGLYAQVVFLRGKKRYMGWVHAENLLLPPNYIKKLNPTTTSQEETSEGNTAPTEIISPPIIRNIENTFLLPQSISFVSWQLFIAQRTYNRQLGGTEVEEATQGDMQAALKIIFGVTNSFNLIFKIPYLIYSKERFASTTLNYNLESKGFADFEIGFKHKILSQKNLLLDLNLIGLWKSGFMPHDSASPNKNGDAGTGSHDFSLGFASGKSFRSLSPYFNVMGTYVGSNTSHSADDSETLKYKSHFTTNFALGFEFPQFLPILLIDLRTGYEFKSKRIVTVITSDREETIDPIRNIIGSIRLFLYRGKSTYIFQYAYEKKNSRAYRQYWIDSDQTHNFTLTYRF